MGFSASLKNESSLATCLRPTRVKRQGFRCHNPHHSPLPHTQPPSAVSTTCPWAFQFSGSAARAERFKDQSQVRPAWVQVLTLIWPSCGNLGEATFYSKLRLSAELGNNCAWFWARDGVAMWCSFTGHWQSEHLMDQSRKERGLVHWVGGDKVRAGGAAGHILAGILTDDPAVVFIGPVTAV